MAPLKNVNLLTTGFPRQMPSVKDQVCKSYLNYIQHMLTYSGLKQNECLSKNILVNLFVVPLIKPHHV